MTLQRISPQQCRAARGWLDWSQEELAATAAVPVAIVRDFEGGGRRADADELDALRAALEAGGIGFVFVDGRKPCGITYASPIPGDAH